MTKELRLEECVSFLSSSATTNSAKGTPHAAGFVPSGGTGTVSSKPNTMIRRNSKSDLRAGTKCTIRLLDDNEAVQCDFQSHTHKGQYLMDFICRQLNIAEKDYFGLRYVDSNKQRHWLDLGKSIAKQLKEMTPYIVCLRFKFYPNDPMLLKEEVTRYQLVLQLRRDILHGRLYSTLSDMATLASFIIQSELGDYDPDIHRGNYVAEYEVVSRQSNELEEKATELHQKLRGLTPTEADVLFLKKSASLDTYGVDPHPVKDQQGEQVYLGINHTGISTFQGSRKSTHFKWSQITKLNYEAKMFIIHLSIAEDSRTKKKETVGFKCQTSSSCKYLWRCAVEQRLFFNCGCATEVPSSVRGGGIFGSRFRYSGRVQREILEDPGPLRAADGVLHRTPLYRSLQRPKTRSLPHSPLQIGFSNLGYGSLPRSNHSAPPNESTRLEGAMGSLGSSTSLPLSTLSSPYCPEHTLPLLETLQEDKDSPRVEDKERVVDVDFTGKGDSELEEAIGYKSESITGCSVAELAESDIFTPVEDTLGSISEDLEAEEDAMDVDAQVEADKDWVWMGKSIGQGQEENSQIIRNGSISSNHIHHNGIHSKGSEKQPLSKNASVENENSDFVPVYHHNEASESMMPGDDKALRDSRIDQIAPSVISTNHQNNLASYKREKILQKPGMLATVTKIFLVCFVCVLIALLFVAIVAIEVEVDICQKMRRIPEVEIFQTEVYEPIKFFIRDKIFNLSNNLPSK